MTTLRFCQPQPLRTVWFSAESTHPECHTWEYPWEFRPAIQHLASRAAGIAPAAGATVGGTDALGPAELALIGRGLFHRGEALLAIRTDGGLRLEPAASWDIESEGADERDWVYRVDISGPSGNRTERIGGPGVLHVRYAANPETPWAGTGPLALAGVSAEVLALIECVWKCELGGPLGYLLPLPRAAADDQSLDALREGIAGARCGLVTVKTTQGGYGTGRIEAP